MTTIQATQPDFELGSLGWKAFQDLCATITGEVLGQTSQVFLPSNDGGRDGAFRGTWEPKAGEIYSGSFTVQCKFGAGEEGLLLSGLDDELQKARRLAKRGYANTYLLMTNQKLSGRSEEQIRSAFLAVEGIQNVLIFGRDWITQKIRESPRLRMLVPRVYGLGDLSQILDERAYNQAAEILSSLRHDLAKFVVTTAHTRAARALVEHGFVLLLGEPAAGKSTIAASLALGAIDLWGCSTLKIRNAGELVEHWNPHEPKQFFWVDDAFGPTQYQRELANDWNSALPHLAAAVKRGARILFTSRDYIYRAARYDLKVGAFPLLNESQVIIDVQGLQPDERDQILYNHMRLGTQAREFRKAVKAHLPAVSRNPHFLPEIARRLGDPLFTRDLLIDRQSIRRFVEEPLKFLVDVVAGLDRASQAALALIFIRGGLLESPITLLENENEALSFYGVTLHDARSALTALDGSLVVLLQSGGRRFWSFKHPTISDAYASLVAENPELLDFYLRWTRVGKLMREVTCGDVGLEGVRVIVPESRYQLLMTRLSEVDKRRELLTFLATRCDRRFLAVYLQQNPGCGESLAHVGSYLHASSEVDMLGRLQTLGLLNEEWRLRFVQKACDLAVETPDLDMFAIDRVRRLFSEQELDGLRRRLENELVPALGSIVAAWADRCSEDEDPEEYFSLLRDVVETLKDEFADVSDVTSVVQQAITRIEQAVDSIRDERWKPDEPEYDGRGATGGDVMGRSIFDDVDA